MITNLPITEGMQARCIYLAYSGTEVNPHESNGYWTPVFIPTKGICGPYGGLVDPVNDWNQRLILQALSSLLVGLSDRGQDITLEEVDALIHRGGLKIYDPYYLPFKDLKFTDTVPMVNPYAGSLYPEHSRVLGKSLVLEEAWQLLANTNSLHNMGIGQTFVYNVEDDISQIYTVQEMNSSELLGALAHYTACSNICVNQSLYSYHLLQEETVPQNVIDDIVDFINFNRHLSAWGRLYSCIGGIGCYDWRAEFYEELSAVMVSHVDKLKRMQY